MRFWDSSAIVPLLAGEASSDVVGREYQQDADLLVWWATPIECVSALARREREGRISGSALSEALRRLEDLELAWHEVQPVDRVRGAALRLLRVHALGAADALQLAAAIIAAEDQPRTLPFMTLDARLALAAEREGFPIGPST